MIEQKLEGILEAITKVACESDLRRPHRVIYITTTLVIRTGTRPQEPLTTIEFPAIVFPDSIGHRVVYIGGCHKEGSYSRIYTLRDMENNRLYRADVCADF